jgi:hypothetical protein
VGKGNTLHISIGWRGPFIPFAPATDRLVRDLDTTLEQQFPDVAQAQTEPEIPANRATDVDGREAVTVIKGFSFLHHFILPPTPHQPDRAWCEGRDFVDWDLLGH